MIKWRESKDKIEKNKIEEIIDELLAKPNFISTNEDARLPGKKVLRLAVQKQFPGEEIDWN